MTENYTYPELTPSSYKTDFAISITFGESHLKASTFQSDARSQQAIPAMVGPYHHGLTRCVGCGRGL